MDLRTGRTPPAPRLAQRIDTTRPADGARSMERVAAAVTQNLLSARSQLDDQHEG
jgi:hypothetical protein